MNNGVFSEASRDSRFISFVKLEHHTGCNLFFVFLSDVLASQDQTGGDATVTIDQRKCCS